MESKVIKVLNINDSIIFVISQKDGFYTWEISTGEWFKYWERKAQENKQTYLLSLGYTPVSCDMFINDPVNDTVGTSTGSFDTVEEALKYYEIL